MKIPSKPPHDKIPQPKKGAKVLRLILLTILSTITLLANININNLVSNTSNNTKKIYSDNINRYYNPTLGRYMQSDPIGLDGGVNTFGYVGGNPVVRVDESGLKTLVIHNGATDGNPFGHTALAFSGSGLFSFGTGDTLGANLIKYIKKMAPRRNTRFTLINTTPIQEMKMQLQLRSYKSDIGYYDNCAFRSSKALDLLYEDVPLYIKLIYDIERPGVFCCHLPIQVEFQATEYMVIFGGKKFTINKTKNPIIPNEFYGF